MHFTNRKASFTFFLFCSLSSAGFCDRSILGPLSIVLVSTNILL